MLSVEDGGGGGGGWTGDRGVGGFDIGLRGWGCGYIGGEVGEVGGRVGVWGGGGVREGDGCWVEDGDVGLVGLCCRLAGCPIGRLIGLRGREGVNVDSWGWALLVICLFLHWELCRPCRPRKMRWQYRHLAIPCAFRVWSGMAVRSRLVW